MQIESSVILRQETQSDGRIVVREQHIDDSGVVYDIDYMAGADDDLNAHLALDAANIEQSINDKIAAAAAYAAYIASGGS